MNSEPDNQTAAQVRRRKVFYIPGYDPIHPRRYRELYRSEAAAQAAISGFEIDLTGRKGGTGPFGWHVDARIEGKPVAVDFEVLVWSDIVRRSMSNSIISTYLQLLRTAWTYVSTGALRRLMWLRKGPVIAALYPVGLLILQALIALLVGWLAWRLLLLIQVMLSASFPVLGKLFGMTAFAGGVACFILVLRWFRDNDGRFFAYYLMHDFAHSARWRGAYAPDMEQRMAGFRDHIARATTGDYDEVLVVGHSSGAHVGVSVLADLLRAGPERRDGPALGFLSLGQVVPMVSFLPDAHRLRGDLQFLSQHTDLTWVDISAPGDGCSFALCDPVTVTGVATKDKKWPLVLSAAFTRTLSPERWKSLRWRFFRLHFQYLCAFDRPGDFDYFRVTAGPQTLSARFSGREGSRSRIDVPASKYTSVRAA